MRPPLFKFFALMLAICFLASTIAAETPVAMLYATGNFALNGSAGPRSSAIMPGDQIQTREGSSVNISSSGNNVLIGPNSSVTYESGAIQFHQGSALITTANSMAAEVQGVRVTPAQPAGTYRITREGDQVRIAAIKGALVLREGGVTRTVAEGRAALMPEPVPQAVPGAQEPVGGRPSAKVGIALGAAALAATSIVIFTQIGGDDAVSPVLP
jgi:hypothetical protein